MNQKSMIGWLKKQGEQKSTDKVEPKFRIEEDKWYVCVKDLFDNYANKAFYKGDIYLSTQDGCLIPSNSNVPYNIAYPDPYFRNWTIQDAKDGDVLVTPNNNIFIFKEIRNHWQVYDHCGLYFDSLTAESSCVNGIFSEELPNDYKPATKEQSDLLFQKMKEAGYEWDDGKNELKKIGQNPTEDNCKISDCDIKVSVKKSASAWSEKDNGMMVLVAKILYNHKSDTDFVLYNTTYGDCIKWLKSIKERMKGD